MKKTISLVIALVMVLTVLALPVAAETTTTTLDVNWHLGYVGSSTNSSFTNVLNPNGGAYSYSDIIDMGPAGSTITFTDDVYNFASASAYVFSFWKEVGDEYVLDTEAANIPGTGGSETARTYKFTATKDNQYVRLSYRSEETTDSVPETRPTVYVNGTAVDGVTWSLGYNKADGTTTTGGSYSKSSSIKLAKKGDVLTFTDDASGFASNGAAVFITVKEDGTYDGISVVGGSEGAALGSYTSAPAVTYTYTSTKDNELIRISYRSGETSDVSIPKEQRPAVKLTSPVVTPPAGGNDNGSGTPSTGDNTILLVLALITVAGATTYFSCKKSRSAR